MTSLKAMTTTKRRPTLAELAALLDLDPSSISLALRNSPKISLATRKRVQQTARREGYQPNLAARQLKRSGGPYMITLVLPQSLGTLRHVQPVATIRELSEMAAAERVVFNILSRSDLEAALDGTSGYPLLPDGALVWGDVSAEAPRWLEEWRIPHVVLDPVDPSYTGYKGPGVWINNTGGAAALARHLLQRGARRLLFVGSEIKHLAQDGRWQAVQQIWRDAGRADAVRFCPIERLSNEDLRQFAQQPDGAIFGWNDGAAMQVWHRLVAMRIWVPEQVRLAGFDGDGYGKWIDLTTAIFEARGLARAGWNLLTAAIKGKAPRRSQQVMDVALHLGATT